MLLFMYMIYVIYSISQLKKEGKGFLFLRRLLFMVYWFYH